MHPTCTPKQEQGCCCPKLLPPESVVYLPEEVYTVLSHTFERYDGKGLPDGLKGKEIPQGSRIIAVVDAFMHLLTFEKNGSNGNPYKESLATIKPLGNTYFDPKVVDALEDVIIDRLVDENSPRVLIRQCIRGN